MAKRDPNKTARNKRIEEMKNELRDLLPTVLKETGFVSESSLNAKIGGKADEFIDLKNEIITSPEHYASLYLDGFKESLSTTGFRTAYDEMYDLFNKSKSAQKYMLLFLERSYLKHYEEYSKRRPRVEEAEIWIGQNSADYGLFVTPRFAKGDWENDRSEIRHFKPGYWTVGHVLETGFVIPNVNKKMLFDDVDKYLDFFENVLVRHSKSKYQIELAERYSNYVRSAPDPLKVPLLIPEIRYEGRAVKHKYRLDFTVIDPLTLQKVGFELSPWSTHGNLTGTKGKTQVQINSEASENFNKEMSKHKKYYKKHGIFTLIYTDSDLKDVDNIFADIEECLNPKNVNTQLNFHILSGFFSS
tara:strand:- start:1874 stop:2947 length:1074 start_codon:yes stop_codon:yes gene_type:complete